MRTKGFTTIRIPKKPFHNKKIRRKRDLTSYGNSEDLDLINTDNISFEVSLIWVREILKERNKK